jgi:hypothetical protein
MSISHAVEHALPQRRLKKDYKGTPHEAKDSDYEEYGKSDTISFWFVGGTSLAYRVDHEITQEDFDRVKVQMENLHFRTKDDRKPSDNKTTK